MSSERHMSGAELKVQLTGLGLTPAWLADQLDIAARTVVRWCGQDRVPAKAVAVMDEINDMTDAEMNRIYQEMLTDGGVLRTYRRNYPGSGRLPATWHRALTFRVLEHVRRQRIDCTVGYVA